MSVAIRVVLPFLFPFGLKTDRSPRAAFLSAIES